MLNFAPEMFPITNPTLIFFLMLGIILLAPMLLQRIRVPHIIGMMLAGLAIGPNGFHILDRGDSFELFGKVGLYYIMFLASLEMDMGGVRRERMAVAVAGVSAFVFPLLIGVTANIWLLHLNILAAFLLAGMYSSHTLVAFPIVARYGLARHRAVTIAVGGTIVADTLTLLLLAFVQSMAQGGDEPLYGPMSLDYSAGVVVALLVLKMIAVSAFITFVYPKLCRWFLRCYREGVMQYVFILALVFAAAALMELIGVEGLLGAFLAGVVLNRQIPRGSPLMNHLEFVGNAIFIPYFLVGVGMLINLRAMVHDTDVLFVAIVMISCALVGKWIASAVTAKMYRMNRNEMSLLFGLSNARAAATIAIVLIGYSTMLPNGEWLLNEAVFNATFLLILVSCIVSTFVTEDASRRIVMSGDTLTAENESAPNDNVLVALAYQETVDPLMNLALLMRGAKEEAGITAMNVFYEDDREMRLRGREVLEKAQGIAASAGVPLDTRHRASTNLASGIIHTMIENNFGELLVAQHIERKPGGSFYGPVLLDLLTGLNRQIMMVRCKRPWATIRAIHVAVPAKAEFEAGFHHWCKRIGRMGEAIGCRVTFHANFDSIHAIRVYMAQHFRELRAEYNETDGGNELKRLHKLVNEDHLLVVICARRGSISYRPSFAHIPTQIRRDYLETSTMLIFPDGYESKDASFIRPTDVKARYES